MVHAQTGRHWATRRVQWFGLAAFVLAGATAPACVSAQLAVDQAEIVLEPRGAGRGIASFNVANESDTVIEATIYLADWDRREDGEHRFYASGSLPQSCGRVLRVFPLSLRLTPRAVQAVRLVLEGADTLTTACWSVVFVENAPTPARGGRQVSYVARLGVKVYGLPSGLSKDGSVDEIRAARHEPAPGAPAADTANRDVVVTFRNSGGMPLWVRGKVEFRRLDNSVAATAPVSEFPVLPGARRVVAVALPKLARGRYVALALLDYGGADILGAQTMVEVP